MTGYYHIFILPALEIFERQKKNTKTHTHTHRCETSAPVRRSRPRSIGFKNPGRHILQKSVTVQPILRFWVATFSTEKTISPESQIPIILQAV